MSSFAEREQAALRWMYAGVANGEEPASTIAAMFQERADAEGRAATAYHDECAALLARAEAAEARVAELVSAAAPFLAAFRDGDDDPDLADSDPAAPDQLLIGDFRHLRDALVEARRLLGEDGSDG
jgi:hypothetical protein